MAIAENKPRVPRLDGEFRPGTRTSISGSDDGSDGGATASSTESDDHDLSEPGDPRTEICQVGDESCSVPVDLYDLPDLGSILSLDTWNNVLSEEDRFKLAEFLPSMDQETFAQTLRELFSGANFHFGSPLTDIFRQLKGGLCDPSLVLYRRGANLIQRRAHYYRLRKYHNSMVKSLVRIKTAFESCLGDGIDERICLLKAISSQRHWGFNRDDVGEGADSESGGSGEQLWNKRLELGRPMFPPKKNLMGSEERRYPLAVEHDKEIAIVGNPKKKGTARRARNQMRVDDEDYDDRVYEMGNPQWGKTKSTRKTELWERYDPEGYIGSSRYHGWGRDGNQVTVASYNRDSVEALKEVKYSQRDWMSPAKDRAQPQAMKGATRRYKDFPVQADDPYLHSNPRGKSSQEKIRSKSAHSEETESDSSGQGEEDGDSTPVRKMVYPSGSTDAHRMVVVEPVYDSRMAAKPAKLEKKMYPHFHDRVTSIDTPGLVPYKKWPQKGRTSESYHYLHDVKPMKKVQVPHQVPSLENYTTERKRKGIDMEYFSEQSNYRHGYGNGTLNENESFGVKVKLAGGQVQPNKSGSRSQLLDSHMRSSAYHELSNVPLLGCNTMTKKRKGKTDAMSLDTPDLLKKKGKKKADTVPGSLTVETLEPVVSEKGMANIEVETGPKKPFTLITPTIHTGFSFSIIHLLSAIRKAMVSPHAEDLMSIGNHLEKGDRKRDLRRDEQSKMLQVAVVTHPELAGPINLPSLTVQEIVNRVRSNPGDPCILETQEPLQDLIRGALKIFSSKTAPLGAKEWKALVFYEKSDKSWSWVGPVFSSSPDNDTVEEETSSESWGIPRSMLVKLVDAFANWLKCGQEALQQIGSLPAPPTITLPNIDEKERFKDLRAQKSLNTISPSSDEVRAYFRREEFLRYSVPDRAFSYTAADGKKSIVAPLRRGGGKPSSKARDHFMLKPDRPPHVTILCLVRDAAARLPGSIGTRSDVCTLIRDSQYIVEDVPDAQVAQVVSGALDRLHSELDPCVRFDSDRKLWFYLHRDREEEDFEDDGTSSTKKWKRPRKDTMDHSDMGAVNDLNLHGDPALNPDLDLDSSSILMAPKVELIYNGSNPSMENFQPYVASTHGERSRGHPVSWDGIGLNASRENKMFCQENSTSKNFDDEEFCRESPSGLLGARYHNY